MNQRALVLAAAIVAAVISGMPAAAQGNGSASTSFVAVELTSEQRAKLAKDAAAFVQTMAHGPEAQSNAILRRLYPTNEVFAPARAALIGPSEYPDRRGFRDILRSMKRTEILLNGVYIERGSSKFRMVATALVFDPTVASPEAIESDKDCLQHRTTFLAQQFEWNGMTWEPCCHLFFSETDGPCGCCEEN